jgi:DNA-directed RNA polymerase subunit M/transcription elongation factor TFIIS
MATEDWKVSAEGWRDEKDTPSEPNEWYEVRWVDEDGEVTRGGIFGSWFARAQYRRRSQASIDTIRKQAHEKAANQDHAFAQLPTFAISRACPKCKSPDAKVRWQDKSDKYGENGVLHRTCRCCRYIWTEKPLTDLDWLA